ncbi:hypothetical protein [Mycobacterium canetti]|nr:hypothetical protein [Mycobacterium canetti]
MGLGAGYGSARRQEVRLLDHLPEQSEVQNQTNRDKIRRASLGPLI